VLSGHFGAGTAISLESKTLGTKQYKIQESKSITVNREGTAENIVNFAFNAARSTAYAVAIRSPNWKSRKQTPLHYSVTALPAPVILNLQKPGAEVTTSVNSSLAAIKLYPNQPMFLGLGDNVNMEDVEGVRTLFTDSEQVGYVVESSSGGYALLSSFGDDDHYPVDKSEGLDKVEGKLLTPGPSLSIGARINIKEPFASIEPVNVEQENAPFGIETSCKSGDKSLSTLLDSGNSSVTSTVKSVPEGSILAPSGHGSHYQLILLTDPANEGSEVDCQVAVRSFARQAITTARDSKIGIDAGSVFNAYPIRLPIDSVIVVPRLNGVHASLSCPSGQVTESGAQRLLAFVPANRDCMVSIANSSGQASEPISSELLIDPVSGGRG
jgi:hypothetical protein